MDVDMNFERDHNVYGDVLVDDRVLEDDVVIGNRTIETDMMGNRAIEEDVMADDRTMDDDVDRTINDLERLSNNENEEYITPDGRIDKVIEPNLGMEFDTLDEVKLFYNAYAKHSGFSIRCGKQYRSRTDESVISKYFFCSKQGFKEVSHDDEAKKVLRPSIREGCKAFLTVKRRNEKWYIAKFEKNHNHELGCSSRSLRSQRKLTNSNKESIDPPLMSKLPLRDVGKFIKGDNGLQRNVTHEDCDVTHGKSSNLGIDARVLLQYCECKTVEDAGFCYTTTLTSNQCLSNIFWVDGRSRIAYENFGDVIIFDTTWKVNLHQMSFATFTGINHHRQSILFGSALLSDETESTFVWLFKSWLTAMIGRHPISIVTNQDEAVREAIKKVFPHSRHRFCLWNILGKIPEKLSPWCRTFQEVQFELENCVRNSITIDEFEGNWKKLLHAHHLENNDWLSSLYDDRYNWVPVYMTNTFFAGVSTIHGSGSINSLFDGYINEETSLSDFIQQHEKALDDRYEKEAFADFKTLYTSPVLKSLHPVEKQASEIYTKEAFKLFQEQFTLSLVYVPKKVSEEGSITTYEVSHYEKPKSHIVTYIQDVPEPKFSCQCHQFEFEGILCRHILAIFRLLFIFKLPSHCILNRWTMHAKTRSFSDVGSIDARSSCQTSIAARYNNMMQKLVRFAQLGCPSMSTYNAAVSIYEEAMTKLENLISKDTSTSQDLCVNEDISNTIPESTQIKVHLPLRPWKNQKRVKNCDLCHSTSHETQNCPL